MSMKKLTSLLIVISMVLNYSCTKITDDDINREVALNIANTVKAATQQLIPSDIIGDFNTIRSWNGGTVEVNGTFSGNSIGDYTIKFTNVTYEYSHKEGKKEWKSTITQNGTLDVSQSGSNINANASVYSSTGTVKLKNKEKKHSGSGSISISISGNVGSANIYGYNVNF